MAGAAFQIMVLGDRAIRRGLKELPTRLRNKVLRQSFRASLERMRAALVQNLSGEPVAPLTGRYREAMRTIKQQPGKRRRGIVRRGLPFPTREVLGIAADNPYYYPTVLEYGSEKRRIPALAPARRAVDDDYNAEARRIGIDVGKRVQVEALKAFRGARA